MKVRDGREIRRHFTLDRHGFVLTDNTSAVVDFYDVDEVNRVYPAEVARSVQALTGATFVVPGGWMIRNSGDISRFQKKKADGLYVHAMGVQPPAGEAHIDTEPGRADRQARAAYAKARPNGPGFKRFIYSSFWRTFSDPPQDCPLAVCDHRSVRDDEGVPNVLHIVDKIPEGEALFAPMAEDDKFAAAIFRLQPGPSLVVFFGDDAGRGDADQVPRLRPLGRLAHPPHRLLGYQLPRPQGPGEHRVPVLRLL